MTIPQRLRFAELPPELGARLVEADFLQGRFALHPDHLIVWTVNRAAKQSHELEWSRARGDFLTNDERAGALAEPRDLSLPEPGLRATLSYALADGTQHLEEHLIVVTVAAGSELVRAFQDFYSPVRFDPVEFAQQELARARFPSEYARWKDEVKVDYWMRVLYRLRRSNGEAGYDEDAVLSPGMVDDMRRIDPYIQRLLPALAKALAGMEGGSAAEMLRKLTKSL